MHMGGALHTQLGGACHKNQWCMRISQDIPSTESAYCKSLNQIGGVFSYFAGSMSNTGRLNSRQYRTSGVWTTKPQLRMVRECHSRSGEGSHDANRTQTLRAYLTPPPATNYIVVKLRNA